MNTKIQEYDNSLEKMAFNVDVIELLRACILDEEETREAYYRETGSYPTERNLLMKLKFDLIEKREALKHEYE